MNALLLALMLTLPPEVEQKIDGAFAELSGTRTPGCAAGVMRSEELVFARGYGMASLEHHVAITPKSVFGLQSTSKQFIAMGIILLIQDGKLSFDDDVRKYVPELPDYGATITIRHLLEHTSGLRDVGILTQDQGWTSDNDGQLSRAHLLRLIVRQKALNHPPGAAASYTNSGYFLLPIIAERITGERFGAMLERRVFAPLGMRHTVYRDDEKSVVPGRVMAYGRGADGVWRMAGNEKNNVFTTVEDLARWSANFARPVVDIGRANFARPVADGRANFGRPLADGRANFARPVVDGSANFARPVADGRANFARPVVDGRANFARPVVGGAEAIRWMTTWAKLRTGETTDWGLGLSPLHYRGLEGFYFSGGGGDGTSVLARFPAQDFAVSVLCNAALPINAETFAQKIIDAVLAEDIAAAVKPAAPDPPDPAPVPIAPEALQRLAGLYFTSQGGPWTRELRVAGDTLQLVLGPERTIDLIPLGNGRFRARGSSTEYELDGNRARRFAPNEPVRELTRVDPSKPVKLDEFTGTFTNDEVEADITFTVRDGKLHYALPRQERPDALDPLFRDAFADGGLVFRFRRDARGRVTGVTKHWDRAWEITFRKR